MPVIHPTWTNRIHRPQHVNVRKQERGVWGTRDLRDLWTGAKLHG